MAARTGIGAGGERGRTRIAVLSLHTSPLDQPGTGDSGGMNVYIRAAAERLAARGVDVDVFTRCRSRDVREVEELSPGSRIIRVKAGPCDPVPKADLPRFLPEFLGGVLQRERREGRGYDVVHSHYWLSGWVGRSTKEIWGVPLVASFHTLGKVKNYSLARGEPPEPSHRLAGEEAVIEEADRIMAATPAEAAHLVGLYGAEKVERDATGRRIRVLEVQREAEAGDSLQLTIDVREQKLAERAVRWAIEEAGLKRGVMVVMNPQTGEVLAMVSLPTYDNNAFAEGISNKEFKELVSDPNQPLLNHAIADQFPPGSTFKLVTGLGALAEGKLRPSTVIQTAPYVALGQFKFWDWNRRGFGPLTIIDGFAHSSDTFFYQVAQMLGMERLAKWAKQLGFGAPTGIDLPGEVRGIVPSDQWKQDTFGEPIFPGEVLQAGIGQGYDTATPLQVLNAYCAVANGGTLYQPQVVREIVGADGRVVRSFKPNVIRKLDIDASDLKVMRLAARQVVKSRHTYNLVDLPIMVAGKTGTAEFGKRDAKGRLPFHNWFVGFVPKNPYKDDFSKPDSQLAVLAFAYDSNTVGNVATEMVKYYLQLHFDLKVDLRRHDLLKRGNFYGGN